LNKVAQQLKREEDFTVDEKARTVLITEEGVAHAEAILNIANLYDPKNIEVLHHLNQALKAHQLFQRDDEYIVKEGQVIIVDEFTGRLMPGRRYSDGLHQALEAKEGVRIENENQTLATITFQNYFRMYDKLAGMTGTADTEAEEFKKIYNLDVMIIPTHKKMIRIDNPDVIYRTGEEKFVAAVEEIKECNQRGQPVLVGTTSIEKSEHLSKLLKREGIKHEVLNAKHHEKEAEIVAQAGQLGHVTIATNMAGRGTDIVLGEGVVEQGGLHILATERHEARRIDNQLRGRSGRQGDPGSSRFYLSLEDDLLRIFGSDRIKGLMGRLGMDDGEPIEHRMVSNAIAKAQMRVESHNFDIRKHLLEYDDVMNQQREVIYSQRRQILGGKNLKEDFLDMAAELIDDLVSEHIPDNTVDEIDLTALETSFRHQFGFLPNLSDQGNGDWSEYLLDKVRERYEAKSEEVGPEFFGHLTQMVMLQIVDNHWKDHLLSMDHLRDGIGLRGYAQKDPLQEYKREGYESFMDLVHRIKEDTVGTVFHLQVRPHQEVPEEARPSQQQMVFSHGGGEEAPQPVKRRNGKVGRNDPCPCGSGKKYKKCCGKK
jgi:preprotein translocase subunit SecA